MENARNSRRAAAYNRRKVPARVSDPIETALRAYFRSLNPNQKEVAARIRRSPGWLNKYLNGAGRADLSDLIRLTAVLVLAVDPPPPLTAEERKLLRDFASLPPKVRREVKQIVETLCTGQAALRTKSNARSEQKNAGTSGKSPGTR